MKIICDECGKNEAIFFSDKNRCGTCESDIDLIKSVIGNLHHGLDAERAEKIMIGIWKNLSEDVKEKKRAFLKKFLKGGENVND